MASQDKETKNKSKLKLVQVRLEGAIIKRIDKVLKNRSPSPSRHHWILEAIYEKLSKEEK